MKKIIEKAKVEWSTAKPVTHKGIISQYKYISVFNDGLNTINSNFSKELLELYSLSDGIILFKDVEFGQ